MIALLKTSITVDLGLSGHGRSLVLRVESGCLVRK
jgi:hypothetical protein